MIAGGSHQSSSSPPLLAMRYPRARSALALGKTFIHSDSTEFSRPILERAGLIKVSTTTPYEWRRG